MTGMTDRRVMVSGFGRCGSTMLMHMLRAGGLPFADGADPHSGEHPGAAGAHAAAAPGRVVKILDPLGSGHLPGPGWQAIWLDRDPRWQAESMRKFLSALSRSRVSVRETRALRTSLERDRDPAVAALRATCPLLVVSYDDTLRDPPLTARSLASFLPWAGLDVAAMAGAVHDRSPRTLPDLAFEMSA